MAAAVASAINWGDGLRRRRVYRHHRNNAEQGFLTTTALSLPLPRSDSSRNRTLTLLATSFGTNDDRPTPLAGQPGVQQRRGLLGALLINRNATQPAGNRSCKLMDQGDYCANAIRLQGTVASVAACWAAASEHAGCGDEIVSNAPTISVSRSDSEPTVGMQCFCIPKSQACEKPQPSSVGNIVYKCHHLRGVLETTQPAVVNLTAGGWTVRPGAPWTVHPRRASAPGPRGTRRRYRVECWRARPDATGAVVAGHLSDPSGPVDTPEPGG